MQSIVVNEHKVTPSKVVCIGRNYVEHIHELNNEVPSEPVIFVKPNSAISDQLNSGVEDAIHYEVEISLLVENGQFTAVGVGLDLTKREVQSVLKAKGLPWERAKAFDNSAVFSKFIALDFSIDSLRLALSINGVPTQHADYHLMIYKPLEILDNVQKFMRFEDYDILMTGTPKGVGKVNLGDEFVAQLYAQDKLLLTHSWLAQ